MVNDVLNYNNRHLKMYAYADEITIIATNDDLKSFTCRAQKAVNRKHAWSWEKSKLRFSVKKTTAMVLSRY